MRVELTDAEPIPGLLLPTGEVTAGTRRPGTLRLRNARIACAFQLSGKRVLNLGCASGIHSFYMARSAIEVIGIDQNASSIAIAESTRRALGVSNVRFMCGDIRDPCVFMDLPKFDLVIAWGFLHRINDIFALLHLLSPMTDSLSLEWRTPVVPYMSRLRLAYHTVEGRSFNLKNVAPLQVEGNESVLGKHMGADRHSGQTSFWEPTPGAVSAICRWFGFKHSRLLGYGENFDSGTSTVLRKWTRHLANWAAGKELVNQVPLARVHMICEKAPGLIHLHNPSDHVIELPAWDLALQEKIRR